MNKFFTTIAATAAIAAMGLTQVTPAHAATSATTVSVTGAKANVSYTPGGMGTVSAKLYDTNASDAKCARFYTRGYNYILGWGGWQLKGTACAGSTLSIGSDRFYAYSDHVEVKVCAGNDTCDTKRLW